MNLEKFLRGEPLNEDMAALMAGDEEDLPGEESTAETAGITDDDREHLRRLLVEPGWRVLLKLLDSELQRSEDAAKRSSLHDPLGLGEGGLIATWADVAYAKKARDKIVALAESEVAKLKKRQRKPASGEGH